MMSEETVISVIIPHLNQPEALELCLDNLEKQTLARSKYEIIVVDNGSNRSLEPIASRFSKVSFLKEVTPGPGPARNRGVEAARGSIVAFIDADCVAHSSWLQCAVDNLNCAPPGTILGGNVKISPADDVPISPVAAYERVFAFRFKLYIEKHGYSGTGNLVVRRQDFEKIGPFAGIAFAEDMNWGERANKQGFIFRYVPDLVVFHPARSSLQALRVKWDRNIRHDFNAAFEKRWFNVRWIIRAFAVLISPLFDFARVLTSDQIRGARARLGATLVLVSIRFYRAAKMLAVLVAPDRGISWNRDGKTLTIQ